jgi:hypothetical protein
VRKKKNMTVLDWFRYQLQATADGLAWAIRQIPSERLYRMPPPQLGLWQPVRHVYHLYSYECNLALPGMRLWLGGTVNTPEELVRWRGEDRLWNKEDWGTVLGHFNQTQQEQVDLLAQFTEAHWQEVRPTIWGEVTLHWVVSKTYQHRLEHTTTLLQMALFWDFD